MTLTEKAAYIKGLADGIDLDKNTNEGKLLSAIIDLLGDITDDVTDMGDDINDLSDYIEEIDSDLEDVEDFVYDDCDCDEDEEFTCDGNCDTCSNGDDDCFRIECPSCGATINFNDSIDPEDVVCPFCGEKIECIVSEEDVDLLGLK